MKRARMAVSEFSTVLQARAWLKSVYRDTDGADCPCCGQMVKLYKRPLYKGQVQALAAIYRAGGGERFEWVKIADVVDKRADEAKLVHWGFLEESAEKRADGGAAGVWRVTPKGSDWLVGLLAVPKYVLLYDGHFRGFEGPEVYVSDVVDGFDLRELMRG